VSGRAGGPRAAAAPASGQHFLSSGRLAAELVLAAGVAAGDVVVEIGAGGGVLTAELARWSCDVRAIELDAALAARLRARFGAAPNVSVVEGDARTEPLPREPFRVVANAPFGATGALLGRLLDPALPLARADVILQAGAARKRARTRPSTLQSVLAAPWYELSVGRRLPAASFAPPPAVDAAVLVVRRRAVPWLDAGERPRFARFVRRAFESTAGLGAALAPRQLARAGVELGFDRRARPRDLDAAQWVELYRLTSTLALTRR
jgi:23S rRNA (adenine-N6)-dimethyltransferase